MRRGACLAAVRCACAVVNEAPESFCRYFRTKRKPADSARGGAGPSIAEARRGARFGLGRFLFATFRRSRRFQRAQEPARTSGDFVDGLRKSGLVGFRRFVEAGNLPHKLQRSRLHLFRGYRRFKIEKIPDVSAHGVAPRGGSVEPGLAKSPETSLASRHLSSLRRPETVDKSDAISCHTRYPERASNRAARASIHLLPIHRFLAPLLGPFAPGRIP